MSVETRTKRFVPCSAASSASTFVPSTLFRTDSSGLASMRGTCLYAAAWNTTAGRVALEDPADLRGLLHVGERRHRREVAALVLQLVVDLDEGVFGVVDEDDLVGAERRHLPAELGPDRAPAPVTSTVAPEM